MIRFPVTVDQAIASDGEFRAGGTDLQERRRVGLSGGDLVDLRDLPELAKMGWVHGPDAPDAPPVAFRVGAAATMAAVARQPDLQRHYPGLATVSGAGATPAIREIATIGGNLLQRSRCWYYRSPEFECLKNGGAVCHARSGDAYRHSVFDLGPCLAPHPSTLGLVLLAYDAHVEVHGAPDRSVAELFGDGADPSRENTLGARELLLAIVLPPPRPDRWGYERATSRRRAEWPLVESFVRLELDGATITAARVAVGAVAPIPMRLPAVEAALVGRRATQATLEAAAALAVEGAAPQASNAYKVPLVAGTVLEALERSLGRG